MTINQYRIIIDVFRSFGILVAGQRKHKKFFLEIQINQLYVQALLFELELRLGIYLDGETIDGFCCPQAIISALCERNDANITRGNLGFNHKLVGTDQKISWG